MVPPMTTNDPYAKVRGISGALLIFLGARASMRVISFLVFRLTAPPPGEITPEQFDRMQGIDTALLGVENLAAFVGMILFIIWTFRATKAIRASGKDTKLGPGLAALGWFIPFANVVLPWLGVRDILDKLGEKKMLAGIWWILWLINMPLNGANNFGRQVRTMPDELFDMFYSEEFMATIDASFWPYFIVDTAAWAMLVLIVFKVREAVTK